jgi:hypothetical protein
MAGRVIVSALLTLLLVGTTANGQQPIRPPVPTDYGIRVLSPNGGETFVAGAPAIVQWELTAASMPDSIQIRLTWVPAKDAPSAKTSRMLATLYGQNPGQWKWDNVGPVGRDMKIQVDAFFPEKIKVSDLSDDPFVIATEEVPPPETPVLKVLSPNGGEIWAERSTQTVLWDVVPPMTPDSIRIRLTWKVEKGDASAVKGSRELVTIRGENPGKWTWEKVGPIGEAMKIQVDAYLPDKKKVTGASDDYFAIVARKTLDATVVPACKVLSPNGGETWKVGSKHMIKWTSHAAPLAGTSAAEASPKSAGVTEIVRITLSRDAGKTWEVVADRLELKSASWEWAVPNAVSDKCRLRVALLDEKSSETCQDASDADFRIVPADVAVPRNERPTH